MSLKISSICLKCSLVAVLLLFWLGGQSQSADFSGVDQFLERNQKSLGGDVVALVYKDSTIVYRKEMGEYFTGKVQAPIGDCSSWLTAALVLSFVDQGKIKLDEPLGQYMPILEKYFKGYITLRNCLTHTTGIENDQTKLGRILSKKKFTMLEESANYLASREISNNPGKEFSYSHIGLTLAARVCEIIGKKSFERLIQERITRPLKMRGTSFFDEKGGAPNPAAGGNSTANDYINFLAMLLNKGTFDGKRILSEKAVNEMETIQFADLPVTYGPPVVQGYHYGMGAWIMEDDGSGRAKVMVCPSLTGTWAVLDIARGYAAILFLHKELKEENKEMMIRFKEAVDN